MVCVCASGDQISRQYGCQYGGSGNIQLFYMSNHYDEAVGAMQNQDAMTDMTLTITEQLMQYTTLLEGISALLVIPIMLFLFHRDRKNEKFLGIVPNKKLLCGSMQV